MSPILTKIAISNRTYRSLRCRYQEPSLYSAVAHPLQGEVEVVAQREQGVDVVMVRRSNRPVGIRHIKEGPQEEFQGDLLEKAIHAGSLHPPLLPVVS